MIRKQAWCTILKQTYYPTTMTTKVRGGYFAKVTPLYLMAEQSPSKFILHHLLQTFQSQPPPLFQNQSSSPYTNTNSNTKTNVSVMLSTAKVPGGQLPLHAACTWGASFDVIQYLIQQYSSGLTVRDDYGNLPLHCACFSGVETNILKLLVSYYPQSISYPNAQGSTPLCIIQRLRHHKTRSTNLQYLQTQLSLASIITTTPTTSTTITSPQKQQPSQPTIIPNTNDDSSSSLQSPPPPPSPPLSPEPILSTSSPKQVQQPLRQDERQDEQDQRTNDQMMWI